MMGNIARLGDSISCGDHLATGSSNVFANGMPISTADFKATTGHGCFPPTILTGNFSSTVFVNGALVAKLGSAIVPHRCGRSTHGGVVSTSAATVSVEE